MGSSAVCRVSRAPQARLATLARRMRLRRDIRRLGPYGRRLQFHAAGAPHQIEFEIDIFRRAEWISRGAHSDDAVAHPPLKRTETLPLQPIDRVAGRLR